MTIADIYPEHTCTALLSALLYTLYCISVAVTETPTAGTPAERGTAAGTRTGAVDETVTGAK